MMWERSSGPDGPSSLRAARRPARTDKRWRIPGAIIVLLALVVSACETGREVRLPGATALTPSPSCRVARVVDGDTVYLNCLGLGQRKARLMGFDTPEVFSPRCREEKRLGDRATQFLRARIAEAKSTDFRFRGQDRYGRDLVRMRIDGRDVAGLMVSNGLAVRYNGGRRIDWCQRLASR